METIKISTITRDPKTERAKDLLKESLLPIEVYGKGKDNLHLKIAYQDFRRAYIKGGSSTILDLEVDKKGEQKVIVHEVTFHPVTDKMIHVDLAFVNMKKEITTSIPLIIEGISPAVKEEGGVLIHNKDEVEIKCLPTDLIHEIKVDISGLEHLHDNIKISDLTIPDKIEVLDSTDLTVISVTPPKVEVEVTPEAEGEEGEAGETAEVPASKQSKPDEGKEEEKKK